MNFVRVLASKNFEKHFCEISRNYQLERLLMMNVEASLLTAHILIMTGRDNYGNWVKNHAIN